MNTENKNPNIYIVGGCQCAAIRYRISCEPIVVYACHCTDCQKQSSSAFGISVWVPRREFNLVSGELKSWSTVSDSGKSKQCAFCAECGSRIYHVSERDPETLSVKGGSMDNARYLSPAGHIWIKSAQQWLDLSNKNNLFFETEPDSFKVLIDHYRKSLGC